MTEKRFTVEKLDLVSDHLSTRFFIVDNENMSSYDVQHIVSEGFEVQFGSWAEKIADKLNDLSDEKEQLKFQLNDCLNHKLFSHRQLEQENEELKQQLKPIQYFADKHGINIFNIEDAFHNCWKDNGKLVTENQELRKSSQDYEDVVNNFFLEHENDFNQELKDEITLLFDIEW